MKPQFKTVRENPETHTLYIDDVIVMFKGPQACGKTLLMEILKKALAELEASAKP